MDNNAAPAAQTAAPVETPVTATPQNFTDYTLQDGTVVQIDKLEQGGMVTVNGQPAPDGTITLTDGTTITIAGGIIAAIQPGTAPAAQAAAPAMMSADEFNAFKGEFENYKTSISSQFAQQNQIIEQQKKAITDLIVIVEELSRVPAANPVEAPKNNFSAHTVNREEKIESLSKALKEIRENKNK